MAEVLARDFLLAITLALGAGVLLPSPFRTQQFGLPQQLLLHRLHFVRRGAAVKAK